MAFSLNETTLLSAVNSGSIFSVINSTISPSWGITYNTVDPSVKDVTEGQEVFTATRWVASENTGDAMVVNSPIEKGSFTSYNKVKRPSEIRVQFAIEGWSGFSGSLPNLTNFTTESRTDVIDILNEMKNTASTYNIETPDTVYESYDLVHFDYAVSAKEGLTLLRVNAFFQEVMQTGEVTISSTLTTKPPATNKDSSRDGAIKTEKNISSTKAVTLDDVRNAWKSADVSLGDALTITGKGIVSGINSAADAVSSEWTDASTSVAKQIKSGISQFVNRVT